MSNKLIIPEQMNLADLGQIFAASGYFTDTRDAAQAIVKILAGQELGLSPVFSMMHINIIKGKISLEAVVMASLVRRFGYDYKILEHSETICRIEFMRKGESLGVSKFDLADAKKAELLGKDNYKKYPRNMMFARAMSNGVRWFCPEVLGGPAYTPGELDAGMDTLETADNSIDLLAEAIQRDQEVKERVKLLAASNDLSEVWEQINEEFQADYDLGQISAMMED